MCDWRAPDRAGRRSSVGFLVPLGDEQLTIELMAADMERLLDQEGIERLPVVGWSMGGFVAQQLARRAPGRVAALFGEAVAVAREQLAATALRAQEAAMVAWHRDGPGPVPAAALSPLVVHGSADVVIPAANAERLAAPWPGARVELFEGGGHTLMAQEPARVAELIRAHVA